MANFVEPKREPQSLAAQEVDKSLLEHNLSLNYEERLRQHQRALDMVEELQKAGRRFYEELRESPQNPPRK